MLSEPGASRSGNSGLVSSAKRRHLKPRHSKIPVSEHRSRTREHKLVHDTHRPISDVARRSRGPIIHPVPETTCDFYPNNPNNPSKTAIIRPKTAESRGYLAQISEFGNGNLGSFLVQPIATHPCRFGSHVCSCSCCSRRTPKMGCVFANATFTGGRATARSHENRSRGAMLSCRVRWYMQGGMRVPYHARAPQQHEQRSRSGH